MNEKNFEYLEDQVRALGFPDRIVEQISDYKKVNNQAFHIYYFNQVEDNQLLYDLRFAKDAEDTYQLKEYELTYKQTSIPDLNIQGINTKDLDDKLKEVNNWYDEFLEHGIENNVSKQEYEKVTDFIKTTNDDLYRLAEIKKGEEVAKLLMYKYFPESEYEKIFPDYQEMQRLYEHKHIFPVNDNIALTAMEAHQFLKADVNSVRESYTSTIAGEHVISDEIFHQINSELHKGNDWIAYNTASYFLDKHDVYFFNNKDEANDFARSNISEFDNYSVINW